jgi:hypothetical protein
MSKHRVLGLKPQLRLERRGQDGQNETEQPDHSASLGDSITSANSDKVFGTHRAICINSKMRTRLAIAESVTPCRSTFRASGVPSSSTPWSCANSRLHQSRAPPSVIDLYVHPSQSLRPLLCLLSKRNSRLPVRAWQKINAQLRAATMAECEPNDFSISLSIRNNDPFSQTTAGVRTSIESPPFKTRPHEKKIRGW